MYKHVRQFARTAAIATALAAMTAAPAAFAMRNDPSNAVAASRSWPMMVASADTSGMTPVKHHANVTSNDPPGTTANATSTQDPPAVGPELALSRHLWRHWMRESEFGH